LTEKQHIRAGADTAFVLGNGPSLADVSLPDLAGFATIGMNAAYRYWREIDWRPRYYACCDVVVGMSHKEEIAALIQEGRIEKFLLRNNLVEALGAAAHSDRVVNFDAARDTEPLLGVNPPTTGTHSALWAAMMGYKKICILGVDGRYKEIVEGAKRGDGIELEIVEAHENPNYFFSGYQQPGDKYNVPNPRPNLHLNAWRRTAARLKEKGVEIYNGNPASAVRCLSFIDIDGFLRDGANPSPAEETVVFVEPEHHSPGNMINSAPPLGQRLKTFISQYGGVLAFGATVYALAAWFWIEKTTPSAALIAFAAGACAALAGLAAGIVYIRFAIIKHLSLQDEAITGLRARIADLERRPSAD